MLTYLDAKTGKTESNDVGAIERSKPSKQSTSSTKGKINGGRVDHSGSFVPAPIDRAALMAAQKEAVDLFRAKHPQTSASSGPESTEKERMMAAQQKALEMFKAKRPNLDTSGQGQVTDELASLTMNESKDEVAADKVVKDKAEDKMVASKSVGAGEGVMGGAKEAAAAEFHPYSDDSEDYEEGDSEDDDYDYDDGDWRVVGYGDRR